jgi:hypothetical protein
LEGSYGGVKEKTGIDVSTATNSYQNPYNYAFDACTFPPHFRVPEFVKFSGSYNKSTREHISQFLAQLGDLAGTEAFRIRLFSLSLTGSAFAWYSSLPPNSINSWDEMVTKFHEHFFSEEYELELVDLAKIRQGREQSVRDYFKRFRDTRNRCFELTASDKELSGLALDGLRQYIKEKLVGIRFYSLSVLHQQALAVES